jgi:hypothetical protein
METEVAVNTPEKTVLDGKSQIEDFYELVKMRQPHQLSKKEEKLIKDFESLIEGKDDADMLQGEAQNLFWKIKDAKELWYRKENISLMEGLGLIGYLESSYSGDKFDINAVEAKSKVLTVRSSHSSVFLSSLSKLPLALSRSATNSFLFTIFTDSTHTWVVFVQK